MIAMQLNKREIAVGPLTSLLADPGSVRESRRPAALPFSTAQNAHSISLQIISISLSYKLMKENIDLPVGAYRQNIDAANWRIERAGRLETAGNGECSLHMIGLIGGMSWESTAVYYRRLNQQVRDRFGGLHSANILMRSVDFEAIVALQKAARWDDAERLLCGIARDLEKAGAACLLICTNTMHKLADRIQQAVQVPLLHIADVTAEAVLGAGLRRPLLLATRYTMEQDFYIGRLRERYGLEPVVPDASDRAVIHDIIFEELCCGVVRDASRGRYLEIIERGRAGGADSVILGCTEIGLLIGPEHTDLPVFDSTLLHADAAVDFATGRSFAQHSTASRATA